MEEEVLASITELYGSVEALKLPKSDEFNKIPADANNPITAEKVELGKLLFHETELGIDAKLNRGRKTYSCASCHHAKAGFQSGNLQGIGEGGIGFGFNGDTRVANPLYALDSIDVQPIKSPTILNVAYQEVMLWNGQFGANGINSGTEDQWTENTPKAKNHLGFDGVETQAIAGMGVHRLNVDETICSDDNYKPLFDAAFPNIEENERYTLLNAALAIAAYERTVLPTKAPFQEFLNGEEDAMTNKELEGAKLFFGKAKCYQCHSGPALTSMEFYALGMNDFKDEEIIKTVDENTRKGRGGFTKNDADNYKFKVPTIYNLKGNVFLGHGGSFNNVREIIEYKNEGIPENNLVPNSQLSSRFKPLELTETEISQLTLFVENALFDPDLNRYVPTETPMGSHCFPNSDEQSKEDMGCN